MSKPLRVIFCLLSIVLVAAMTVACAFIWRNGGSTVKPDDNDSKTSAAESSIIEESESSEETVEETTTSEISEDSVAEESSTTAESSEEESSSAESSDEESSSAESSDEESSSTESSNEESSEEESSVTEEPETPEEPEKPVGGTDPIVVAPGSISTSELDAYFNDSLFVGHSVMVHFSTRTSGWSTNISSDMLGNALFCCTSSFSFYNNEHQTPATPDNVLPKYRGTAYNIEDLPEATGRKTVYLGLMGLNDLGMVGTADTCAELVAEEVFRCIEAIKESSPDTEVVILAATYLTRDKSYTKLNNRNMSLLNNYVLEYCNENGIDFIDVATPLTDGDGYLASVYSIDDYCHLTEKAYYIWMDILRDYAGQKTAGTWANPTSIPLFEE